MLTADDDMYAVIMIERNGHAELVGVESRISAQRTQSTSAPLGFRSPEFKGSSNPMRCINGRCWQYFLYNDGNEALATDVLARFDQKLSHALNDLPSMLTSESPFILYIYLLPPSRYFNDVYKIDEDTKRNFGIAVHLDTKLPASNRLQLAFDEREAQAIEVIVHEFIHFASFVNNAYDDPLKLRAATHSEALAKCYGSLSYIEALDVTSKARLIILLESPVKPELDENELAKAHFKANKYLAHEIKKVFAHNTSPTLIGNQVVLSAQDQQEHSLLRYICSDLQHTREL